MKLNLKSSASLKEEQTAASQRNPVPLGAATLRGQATQQEEKVPFHNADIEVRETVTITNGLLYKLPDNRRVEVWKLKDEDSFCVRIFRPTNDGKVSELLFGLSRDAADALSRGLVRHLFFSDKIEPQIPTSEGSGVSASLAPSEK